MITIITPTLNASETLQRCIDSVRAQGIAVEHLFVDGGSTDGTRAMLGTFIDAPGSNIYEAQNIGINAAKGEWLYFLGADDYMLPGSLYDLEKMLPDVVVGWVRVRINVEGQPHFKHANQQQAHIYRKNLFDRRGLFEENVGLGADARFNDQMKRDKEPCEMLPINAAVFSRDGQDRRRHAST